MTAPTFQQIHEAKSGKVSDKWASYLDFYEAAFQGTRDRKISLLEIGVQNGGSLETYDQYFPNAEILIGCDINPRCAVLQYAADKIKIVVGDANQETTRAKILQLCDAFDFVIDDGSHVSMDILNSFLAYFPQVKPGGLYVIEDTHTLYSAAYGGGLLNEFSAYNFFKKIVDVVNYEWWEQEVGLEAYFATFFLKGVPRFIAEGWIESIEFRNSIISIRKSTLPGHKKLRERIIRGTEFAVVDFGGNLPTKPY